MLQDEVLAISEKVVLRVEDLVTWITVDAEWTWGRLAKCVDDLKECKDTDNDNDLPAQTNAIPLTEGSLDFSDIEKEKKLLGKTLFYFHFSKINTPCSTFIYVASSQCILVIIS